MEREGVDVGDGPETRRFVNRTKEKCVAEYMDSDMDLDTAREVLSARHGVHKSDITAWCMGLKENDGFVEVPEPVQIDGQDSSDSQGAEGDEGQGTGEQEQADNINT